MTMTPDQLYDEFMKVAAMGDEQAAEKFLAEHLNEFPEETRNQIISAFVKDAIAQEAEEVTVRGQVAAALIEDLDDIAAARKEVDNLVQIGKLKEQLGTQ